MKSAATEAAPMLILRMIDGIQSHFKARMTEWIMAFPTGATAFGFMVQPDMFSKSPSYGGIASWATEYVWLWVFLFCFTIRMVALVVNGTFEAFRHSPHLRVLASVICFNAWGWFTGGFLNAYLNGRGAFLIVPACLTLCMIEGLNTFRATTDIALQHNDRKRAGKWTGRGSL